MDFIYFQKRIVKPGPSLIFSESTLRCFDLVESVFPRYDPGFHLMEYHAWIMF